MPSEQDSRETVRVAPPVGGWVNPWPQCFELAQALDCSKWTLVGGLMVQLHAVIAGIRLSRPTVDVDMVLHVETGAISSPELTRVLNALGYVLERPIRPRALAHRFIRSYGELPQVVDVMVADHGIAKPPFLLDGRQTFKVSGGTQALRRTFICEIADEGGDVVTRLSLPSVLGALVLKGAAYREDSRDRERHIEDAAILAALIDDPIAKISELAGSDRSRIIGLNKSLRGPLHPAWAAMRAEDGERARYALDVLSSNPQEFDREGELGPAY